MEQSHKLSMKSFFCIMSNDSSCLTFTWRFIIGGTYILEIQRFLILYTVSLFLNLLTDWDQILRYYYSQTAKWIELIFFTLFAFLIWYFLNLLNHLRLQLLNCLMDLDKFFRKQSLRCFYVKHRFTGVATLWPLLICDRANSSKRKGFCFKLLYKFI